MARKPAKKAAAAATGPKPERKVDGKSNRDDPKVNKSLAIRLTLEKMPKAKAADVADAVKKTYGHTVSKNVIYMIKTKSNMKAGRSTEAGSDMGIGSKSAGASQWINAIKIARQLLSATGSVDNATALLRALDSASQQAP